MKKYFRNNNSNKAFAILFAVVVSSIVLAIALGIANVAYKEITFSTSAKDTNDAFFAADTGAECALYYDRSQNVFIGSITSDIHCVDNNFKPANDYGLQIWDFTLNGLNDSGQGCAIVTVDKSSGTGTIITSKGHNNGSGNGCVPTANTVEREIDVTY